MHGLFEGFFRRHRKGATLAGLILVSFVCLLVMSSVLAWGLYGRAESAREVATRKTAEAEQARIRLEAEKLVAERHAQDLADAKARDDKRHARNLALLAALAAVATMTAAALALLGKFMQ